MTSFTFMLVCVPLPVCQMRSGNWSLSLPEMTSSAAWVMSFGLVGGKFAEILIHQRASLLQDAERADQLRRHGVASNVEVQRASAASARPSKRSRGLRFCPCCQILVRMGTFDSLVINVLIGAKRRMGGTEDYSAGAAGCLSQGRDARPSPSSQVHEIFGMFAW